MKVNIRYFASLREAFGPVEAAELPAGTTAGALRDWLVARGGRYAELLDRSRAVRCAVNQALSGDDTPLTDGAEVAFFPPVTGG